VLRSRLELASILALAIFDWIDAWYNPRRRHSYIGMLSRIDYETSHTS
jgi:putative transposase